MSEYHTKLVKYVVNSMIKRGKGKHFDVVLEQLMWEIAMLKVENRCLKGILKREFNNLNWEEIPREVFNSFVDLDEKDPNASRSDASKKK